jgi:uncharacterized protein
MAASGPLPKVGRELRSAVTGDENEPVLVFNDRTGELIEVDLRGTADEVEERLKRVGQVEPPVAADPQKRGPGRPKLGVIPREVTLLPAQWDWLDQQPGGASAALRRLIYEAKRSGQGKDRARQAQEAVYRFMTTMAGDFPGFEEALRAFYRREDKRFNSLIRSWPGDIRRYLQKLVAAARKSAEASAVPPN